MLYLGMQALQDPRLCIAAPLFVVYGSLYKDPFRLRRGRLVYVGEDSFSEEETRLQSGRLVYKGGGGSSTEICPIMYTFH